MSATPDFQRTDDELVSLLSQWLMRSLGNDELRKRIEEIGTEDLAPGQRTAVQELLGALGNAFPGERGDLEMHRPRDARGAGIRRVGVHRDRSRGGARGGDLRARRRRPARGRGAGDREVDRRRRLRVDRRSLPDRGGCRRRAHRVRRGSRDAGAHVARQARGGIARERRAGAPGRRAARRPLRQGHVDGVGIVRSVEEEGNGRRIWFDAPPGILRYAVEKGSIAVQGASLTVAGLDDAGFAVALIPHTLEATTLGALEHRHGGEPRGGRAGQVRRAAVDRHGVAFPDGCHHPVCNDRARRSKRSARVAWWWSSTIPTARTRATSSSPRSSRRPRRSTSWSRTRAGWSACR